MAIEKTTFLSYTRNSDKKSYSSHEMVRAIDAASDSPTVFHAVDTSCNRSSDAPDTNQNNTTGKSSPGINIEFAYNILSDEAAKPDVIESPANDILISDVEPPDPDDTIYVNKQVNIAQQSQAYCSKQSNCQKLMPNMAIEKTTFPRTSNSDKKSYSSQEIVRAIDAASDSPIVFHAVDTSCNRSSDAQISLHNLVPTTDSDASHIHCTLNCICKKDYDILYHGTMYHTPLNNTQFSIDAYNALIASIYLHQYFCILKILAHSVDFNELYRNVTIHCPSFSLVR